MYNLLVEEACQWRPAIVRLYALGKS